MVTKEKVYSNDNITIVGSIQNYLLQHGIHADIRNEYTSGVMGEAAFFDAWPELWVIDTDVAEAKKLLEQVISPSQEVTGPEWLCKHCNEANPTNFELCWQCSQPK